MMPELERMLEMLSEDELRGVIRDSSENGSPITDTVEHYVRRKLEFTSEDIRTEVSILLSNADDYIFLEKNMFDSELEDLFPEPKAMAILAETICDGFYDRAEMMVSMGMLSEARLFIRYIAETIRHHAKKGDTVLLSLCRESAKRYADEMEGYLITEDLLGGFHKK